MINATYKFDLGAINFDVELDSEIQESSARDKDILHYHAIYEIFFVFDDEIKVVYEDREVIYKNSIVCIPPNVKHYTKRAGDYRFFFSYNIKGNKTDVTDIFFEEMLSLGEVFCIPVMKTEMYVYLQELCYLFYKNSDDVARDIIISVLKIIFFHIYLYDKGTYKNDNSKKKESYYIIISELISRCTIQGNDINVASVAKALHLSKKQTSRIIKTYYKKTLSEVVCEEKLSLAKHLLENSNMSVSEIAKVANFNSETYFYLKFKKKFGVTPLQHRKNKL